ncbi:MAG TPA: tripartite tricarboxylate transporter substrate binding protein [Casimicrobiaceae bacterium]
MRKLLPFLLASLALASAPSPAQVEPYPSKAVKFIVPVPPGGAADVMARMVAEQLQNKLGQPFVVDNRPGAGSAIGMQALAKSPPDGYTIGLGNIAANAINPAVQPDNKLYDPVNDFAPVSLVGITPLVLVVNAEKVPSKTLEEFIAFLKANPNKLSYGSSGNGSSLHLGMELFLLKTGTKMTHIPYKGSAPMVTDLISGQVDASMDAATSSWPHVQSGKLRALAVSTKERAFFAPNLPPIAQVVPGFDVKPWHGVMVPAKTPQPIVDKLSAEIQAFIKDPATQQKLKDRGVVPVGSSAQEFAKVMNDEYDLYRQVVRDANIKAE